MNAAIISRKIDERVDAVLVSLCELQEQSMNKSLTPIMFQSKVFELLCKCFHRGVVDTSVDMDEHFAKLTTEYFESIEEILRFQRGSDFSVGFACGAVWSAVHTPKLTISVMHEITTGGK